MRLILVIALALAACGEADRPAPDAVAQRKAQREARVLRAQAMARAAPGVTRHQVGQGELLRLDVQVPDEFGLLQLQHCFVWRDLEFHTSSISCPAGTDGAPQEGQSR